MKDLLTSLHELDPLLDRADRIMLASDFDGTLCPIAPSPSSVVVHPAMLSALRALQASDCINVAVISGRPVRELRERLPFLKLFAGNHGLEIETDRFGFVHPQAEAARARLEEACDVLESATRTWNGAWVERKRLTATLHYRNVAPAAQVGLLWTARRALSIFGREFALRSGKLALELRPRVDWDKGCALRHITEHLGPADLTICVGDDRTDESMFTVNTAGTNIFVGSANGSAAAYRARDSEDVTVFLWHLFEVCGLRHEERATA